MYILSKNIDLSWILYSQIEQEMFIEIVWWYVTFKPTQNHQVYGTLVCYLIGPN